jgi:hypothetical protein
MQRAIVVALAKADELIDELVYRPAVVRTFVWLPRWWLCDLAKLSIALDDRWRVGYWDAIVPNGPCEACGRRAAIHVYGGNSDNGEADTAHFLAHRAVHTCGWCQLEGPITDQAQLGEALDAARSRSVSWRWRRPTR